MRISSPAWSVNGRSGTRDVPVDSSTPAGNSSSRNRNAASSVTVRRRPAVLAWPVQAVSPPRLIVISMVSPYGSGTSQAGRIPGPAAQPPR